jgi:hypothetical protein
LLHGEGAALVDVGLVGVYLHQSLAQLDYHLGAGHGVVLPHNSPFQAVHKAFIGHLSLYS